MNVNSDLKNKRWNTVDLRLKLRFPSFFNLFQSFSKEQVLELVNLLRFTVYLCLWTFDEALKQKREGFMSFTWVWTEIRVRRWRESSWIFSELLVSDLLLLKTENEPVKSFFFFSDLVLLLRFLFFSSSIPSWSCLSSSPLVMNSHWNCEGNQFDDEDSATNHWELLWILANLVQFCFWKVRV